jgi:hypothetical protein
MLGVKYVPLFDVLCPREDEIGWVRAIWFPQQLLGSRLFFAGDESLLLAEKVSIT